jgi:hypothetical protein
MSWILDPEGDTARTGRHSARLASASRLQGRPTAEGEASHPGRPTPFHRQGPPFSGDVRPRSAGHGSTHSSQPRLQPTHPLPMVRHPSNDRCTKGERPADAHRDGTSTSTVAHSHSRSGARQSSARGVPLPVRASQDSATSLPPESRHLQHLA